MLLALRINVLAKGHSGISLNTLQQYVAAFNGRPPAKNVGYLGFLVILWSVALILLKLFNVSFKTPTFPHFKAFLVPCIRVACMLLPVNCFPSRP